MVYLGVGWRGERRRRAEAGRSPPGSIRDGRPAHVCRRAVIQRQAKSQGSRGQTSCPSIREWTAANGVSPRPKETTLGADTRSFSPDKLAQGLAFGHLSRTSVALIEHSSLWTVSQGYLVGTGEAGLEGSGKGRVVAKNRNKRDLRPVLPCPGRVCHCAYHHVIRWPLLSLAGGGRGGRASGEDRDVIVASKWDTKNSACLSAWLPRIPWVTKQEKLASNSFKLWKK